MSQGGLVDIKKSNPTVATSFESDSGSAVPSSNVLKIIGSTVSSGTNAKPLFTTGSTNIVTAEIQVGAAITGAPGDKLKAGLVSFDDTAFAVDADGYVTSLGGGGLTAPVLTTEGGTGITTYTKGDILYSDATDSLAKLPIAALPGSYLISDDTGIVAWGDDIITEHDEFLGTINPNISSFGWFFSRTATGGIETGDIQDSDHPGVWTLTAAATSDDTVINRSNAAPAYNYVLGGGISRFDFLIKTDTLATAGEDFDIWIGLFTASAFITDIGNDGVVFEYQRSNSTDWNPYCRAASTNTIASGGSTVAVDTNWTHLRIDINAAASNVDFYIDGVDAGSVTTNIPTAAITPALKITKTAGTAERNLSIDAFRWYQKLTNSRWL